MLGIDTLKARGHKKAIEKKRNEIFRRAEEMRKLTLIPNSGWKEYIQLLDEYVAACKKRKALTALDSADDKEIYQLKLIDHEIYFVEQFIKIIPQKIFKNEKEIEEAIKKEQEGGPKNQPASL